MGNAQLIKRLSAALTLVDVADFVNDLSKGILHPTDFFTLLQTCKDPVVGFRASWILDHYSYHHPVTFQSFLPQVLGAIEIATLGGTQRCLTKILLLYTSPKDPHKMQEQLWSTVASEKLVDKLFEWLISPHTPVAVQVNCLDILFYFRHQYPWVLEELTPQIEFLLENGSAAMQSRGKRILKRLQKESRSK
jgi:hypothetical protein